MSVLIEYVLTLAADHPVIVCWLVIFVAFPLLLGWMHEARIIVECGIPFIQHFKRECDEWRETWYRAKREFTEWDTRSPR
jgi:hypothetical protein